MKINHIELIQTLYRKSGLVHLSKQTLVQLFMLDHALWVYWT